MKKAIEARVKMFACGVGAIMLLLATFQAFAKPSHHDHGTTTTINNSLVANQITGVSRRELHESTAKGMACSPSFYMGTQRWQGTVQGAVYHGESAICLGGAKVIGDDADVMINFMVLPDDDEDLDNWGYQAGILFLF